MKKQRKSFKNALDLLKVKKILVDAEVIAKMEAADKGDIMACFNLASNFGSDTKGYTKNYDASMFYMDRLKISPVYLNDPDRMFNVLKQDAYIETAFYKYETALAKYEIALKHMVTHLQPDQWDYNFLDTMSGAKYLAENQAEFTTTE